MEKVRPRGRGCPPEMGSLSRPTRSGGRDNEQPLRCGEPATRGLHFFHCYPIEDRVIHIVFTILIKQLFSLGYLILTVSAITNYAHGESCSNELSVAGPAFTSAGGTMTCL